MTTTGITTKIMKITPMQASSWLASSNVDNRSVRPGIVNKYADRIRAGEWVVVDQLISFDLNGRLLNGQHRLMAVVKTGVSIDALVGFGFPEDTFKYLDQGQGRSKGDIHKANKRLVSVVSAISKAVDRDKTTTFTEFENVRNYLVGTLHGDGVKVEDLLSMVTKTNAKIVTSGGGLMCLVFWCDKTNQSEYLINLFNEAALAMTSLEKQRTVPARTLSLFQAIIDRKIASWNGAEVVRKLLSFANPDKRDLKRIPEANHNEMEELKSWAKKIMAGEESIWERSSKPLRKAGAGAI